MKTGVLFVVLSLYCAIGFAQQAPNGNEVPIATRWALDAAGETQRNSMKSVFLLVCPATMKKGTSFLLSTGVVVTNAHVVEGCTKDNLVGLTPLGQRLSFSKIVTDGARDLAVLRPSRHLDGGLELGSDVSPKLGTALSTWGFPLVYNGPAPLLSVGYVAGYNAVNIRTKTVKHIVVNGAFNPGNSGGPVFISNSNKVVGVVVWKQRLFSENVPTVIAGFERKGGVAISGRFSKTLPDGSVEQVSDQEAIGLVLKEFYDTVQAMIGEAIAVSELKAFLAEHQEILGP